MNRKMVGVILLGAMLTAGCAAQTAVTSTDSQENNKEITTLTWYIDYSWFSADWGENLVSRTITEQTGTQVEFVVPSGDENEMLRSLISSDQLPDLLTIGWWNDEIGEMIQKGMVYPLDELANEYDAYFWQVTDDEVVSWYTSSDGHLYQYPNSAYTVSDYEESDTIASNETFLVRKDIYEAIGSPDMTTPQGFHDAVVKAAELFPTVNGEELIPIGAHVFTEEGCDSFDTFLFDFLAVPYLDENGELYDRYTDESYLTWLKTYRQLREEGYLKDEIFLDTRTQMEEKIAAGRYFCMLYQRTDMADQQKILYANNPEQIYIAVDGPKNLNGDDYQLSGSGINGWTVTLISKKCEAPDKAIQLMSYLLSKEGQLMTWYGVEGETWEYGEDGKPAMYPEVAELLTTDRTAYDHLYGADSCYWMLQNNVLKEQWGGILSEPLGQMQEWTLPYTVYTAQYDVVFEAGSEVNSIYTKLKQLWGDTLPQLLLAPDEETFDCLIEEYKEKRDALGYETYRLAATEQIHDNIQRLGIER